MAAGINLENAKLYFAASSHIRASVWDKFAPAAIPVIDPGDDIPVVSPDIREGAVAHALRKLTLWWPKDEVNAAVSSTDRDFPRFDLAVYEQALWMLEHGPASADGNQNAPRQIVEDQDKSKPQSRPPAPDWSPDALRYLFRRPATVTLTRG